MNGAFTKSNLPAVIAGAPDPAPSSARQARPTPDQAFAAQMLGQGGQRRGLKGGQPVLDAARAAYLETEWRGPDDRRLPAGALRAVKL